MRSALALRTVESSPYNASAPPAALLDAITPNDLFYVRNHFEAPEIDAETWRLGIGGAVARPVTLSLPELKRLPTRSLAATLECAGNGRTRMRPLPPGTPWDDFAVGTAVWTGTPLAGALALAGVEPGVEEVLFTGADSGTEGGKRISFERSLSIEDAWNPEVLLAWAMNGEPLSRDHGAPVRLLVPGWYGVASVKWLARVTLLTERFRGFFQQDRYTIERAPGVVEPVARMRLKSLLASPVEGDTLSANRDVRVVGAAWSGGAAVERVDVSVDGGRTWHHADLATAPSAHAWRPFSWTWKAPKPGEHVVVSRAFDEEGNAQPLEAVWNRLGYAYNSAVPVRVRVR